MGRRRVGVEFDLISKLDGKPSERGGGRPAIALPWPHKGQPRTAGSGFIVFVSRKSVPGRIMAKLTA